MGTPPFYPCSAVFYLMGFFNNKTALKEECMTLISPYIKWDLKSEEGWGILTIMGYEPWGCILMLW